MPRPFETLHTWRAVLALPHVTAVLLSTGVARLARAAVPLTLVLIVSGSTGSFGRAGLAAAVLTVADAVSAPVKGRAADRRGHAAVLVPTATVYATALTAIAARQQAGLVWVLVFAGIAGLAFPPVSGSVKANLAALAPDGELARATYVLESTLQQLLFFAGPLYVAAAASFLSARVALYGVAATTLAGVCGFAAVTRRLQRVRRTGGSGMLGALRFPAVAALVGTTFLHSIMLGSYGVAVTASATAYGVPGAAGLVIAAAPAGGLAGSLLIAPGAERLPRRYLVLLVGTGVCFLPLPFVPFPAIAPFLFAGGLAVTPVAATCYVLMSAATPAAMRTEAFTWLSTAVAAGSALGAGLTGAAADRFGVRLPLALAAVAVFAAAALTAGTRRVLPDTPD